MVAIERISRVTPAIENQIVGVYANIDSDEDSVAGEVDEGDQTGSGVCGGAGGGDHHGELLRLCRGADGVDGTDDGAVSVAAADDG